MGALTRTQPVTFTGQACYRIGNWSLVGLIVGAACTLSSATAVAGLREYSPETTSATTKELPPLPGSMASAVSSQSLSSVRSPRIDYETPLIDPLSVGPVSHDLLVSEGPAPLRVNLHPTVLETVTPAQKPEGGPLLIPLPTAVSAGVCGLLGLAVLLAPRRLRRRLLS